LSTSDGERPNAEDRKKLIKDLAHLSKIMDIRNRDLEDALQKCRTVNKALQRRLRKEHSYKNEDTNAK
tara:strand:- start:2335 stop:2538 length:204 start_codon:yes stop_codon:yes gene_type:complete